MNKSLNILLNHLVEEIRQICYYSESIGGNFREEFKPKTKIQSEMKDRIIEMMDTLMADSAIMYDFLNSILEAEDDNDLGLLLDSFDNESTDTDI